MGDEECIVLCLLKNDLRVYIKQQVYVINAIIFIVTALFVPFRSSENYKFLTTTLLYLNACL